MDKEIFIAFATQKGGIGKTTLTVLTASYLHYVKGYNVAVVDCDAPQNSIADLRAREVKVIGESTYFKALACDHFRRVKKKDIPRRYEQRRRRARRCRQTTARGCDETRPRFFRPAGHAQKRGCGKDALADGLHLRPDQC